MKRYDIIIVGAGTAGMMCAINASKRGKKVCVIEKSDHVGGAMHWSGGHMSAGGTKRQKALGIEDSPDQHYDDIMRVNEGTGDLALIRKAVDLAPGIIDWLEDEGFEFDPICPRIVYGHIPYEVPRTHYGVNNAKSILKVLMPHWDEGVASGHIDLKLEHSAQSFEKNTDRYDTVVCQHRSDTTSFRGDNIVVTSGGYGSNPEMFHDKHPTVKLVSAAYPNSTGEVATVLESLGVPFQNAPYHLSSLGGIELEPGSGRCDFYEGWASILTSVYRQPRDIYVDSNGQRFMREDEINPDTRERILLDKDIWSFWIVFDEAALMERGKGGVENPLIIGWDTTKMKAAAEDGIFMRKADSIQELAIKIDVPENQLSQTVSRFNQMIDDGSDPDFEREYLENKIDKAPYYALKVHASVLVTFGGIKVNKELQVVDRDDKVLPGMYAAGEVIGLGATSGKAFCSGMAITPCLSFGKWLGDTL